MREQTVQVKTGKIGKVVLTAVLAVIMCLVLLGCWYLFLYKEPFSPPEFDPNVRGGLPEAAENMNYGSVTAPTGFSVGLCGTMYQQEDGTLVIDVTNPETNDVNILCEIKDGSGVTLYKSGVISPGNYVERLSPLTELIDEAVPITILVYGYEQDSWYSRGTIELDNILQPY